MELCTFCGVFFEKISDLKEHIKNIHSGAGDSKSNIPEKNFQTEKVNIIQEVTIIQRPEFFRKNLSAVQEGNRFKCLVTSNFCNKKFKTDRDLERHILEEHKESLMDINIINNVIMMDSVLSEFQNLIARNFFFFPLIFGHS